MCIEKRPSLLLDCQLHWFEEHEVLLALRLVHIHLLPAVLFDGDSLLHWNPCQCFWEERYRLGLLQFPIEKQGLCSLSDHQYCLHLIFARVRILCMHYVSVLASKVLLSHQEKQIFHWQQGGETWGTLIGAVTSLEKKEWVTSKGESQVFLRQADRSFWGQEHPTLALTRV